MALILEQQHTRKTFPTCLVTVLDDAVNSSKEHKELSRKIIQLWTNFAATGNPNMGQNSQNDNTEWPKLEAGSGKSYNLDIRSIWTDGDGAAGLAE